MTRKTLFFVGPRQLEIREERMPEPAPDELLVQTQVSAVSAGTEMLLYRGDLPANNHDSKDAISSDLAYPTPYGYAAVGVVIGVGSAVDDAWLNKQVFAFQPHSSHFVVRPGAVIQIPPGLAAEEAVFFPNMETAVNLVQDAAPILGERVLVLGQGVVGLLTSALLREFPLDCLVTVDRYRRRREASVALGATGSLDPSDAQFRPRAFEHAAGDLPGYDLSLELTGNPEALDDAIALTMFSGRIVLGSWYGSKAAAIDLGGRFHRSRIRLIASQVSTISPELSGRWDKSRRFAATWGALARIRPSRWISHRLPLENAPRAYSMIDESPADAIQVVFTY